MTSKRKRILISVFLKIILVTISIWFWYSFFQSIKLFEKISIGMFSLLLSSLAICALLEPVKEYLIFKQSYFLFAHVLNIIFKLLVCFKIIFEPFLVFILVFSVQFILLRSGFMIFDYNIGPGVTYILFVITVVLFAYKGVYLTHFFHNRLLRNEGKVHTVSNELTVKILSAINFRRRIYEIMILMYIISSIEKLSVYININNIFWINYSEISLEVLLTFVAIDGYVNAFMPELIKKEREQYKEIKQYHSLD